MGCHSLIDSIYFLSGKYENDGSYNQWCLRFNKIQSYLCFADNEAEVQRALVTFQGHMLCCCLHKQEEPWTS